MYATSSTKDSSSLVEAYLVASFQKLVFWRVFSGKVCSLNDFDCKWI
jgi:hypothetical protein